MKREPRTQFDSQQGQLEGIFGRDEFGLPIAELSSPALRVLEARYLRRDAAGQVCETPRQMFSRVARTVAAVERKWFKGSVDRRDHHIERTAHAFFELMASLRFLPNSPTLMNAGKSRAQLSACFVLPIDDSLTSVFDTLRDAAIVHRSGGGTGFSFGSLRPKGDIVTISGGRASGPVTFLRVYDVATGAVKQGGTRRGANMAVLPVDHPDIEEFINCKRGGGIENFNISVGVTDAFMRAVERNLKWPLVNPRTKTTTIEVSARRLWNMIAEAAWETGDPGVVFLDRINRDNPTPDLGPMLSTNPCGEQPLLAYESCNLGSINLAAYVEDSSVDWTGLERDVRLAVRFLDNVIEANVYPLLKIEEITLRNRKIGLGVMGWADFLVEQQIPYASDTAVVLADEVMGNIRKWAVSESERLAAERGVFSGFNNSLWAKQGNPPRRNATVTTVAPTGTISLIAGVSSGIEPIFSLAYERRALDGERFVFIHPKLKSIIRNVGTKYREILSQVLSTGSIENIKEIDRKTKGVFRVAAEIDPKWHIRMQAAFQKHCENGVSKTINLPATAKASEVKKIYLEAYRLGCKGITIFRDTSKGTQVLSSGVAFSSAKTGKRSVSNQALADATAWLLDDHNSEKGSARKKISVSLANLSRSRLRGR